MKTDAPTLLQRLLALGARTDITHEGERALREVMPVTVPMALLDEIAAALAFPALPRGRPGRVAEMARRTADFVASGAVPKPQAVAWAIERGKLDEKQARSFPVLLNKELRKRAAAADPAEQEIAEMKRRVHRRNPASGFIPPDETK